MSVSRKKFLLAREIYRLVSFILSKCVILRLRVMHMHLRHMHLCITISFFFIRNLYIRLGYA